jgi:lysozyme
MITVIDLSHWSTVTDWNAVAASGVAGVFHKASQGSLYRDPTYRQRMKDCPDSLLWGAYHFGDGSDVGQQVDNFLSDWPGDIALALDWERNPDSQMELWQAREFVQAVYDQTGIWPLLYSGGQLKDAILAGGDPGVLLNCRLWLAEYGPRAVLPRGWDAYWLWQHTDTGTVPGISGHVDLSWFDGDLAALTAGWVTDDVPPALDA